MKAKNKAKELVEKYRPFCTHKLQYDEEYFNINEAKECALICVDEMLDCNTTSVYWEEDFEFWKEVKLEINKL
jgi:hypothetical protein